MLTTHSLKLRNDSPQSTRDPRQFQPDQKQNDRKRDGTNDHKETTETRPRQKLLHETPPQFAGS